MSGAWIGLGSSQGQREVYLRSAAAQLSKLGTALFASVYETSPVYPRGIAGGGEPFLNTVCRLETSYNVVELFAALLDIERKHGRTRQARFAARTLDLDLLSFDQLTLSLGEAAAIRGAIAGSALSFSLLLPHPRMHLRRFVLAPLAEINPHWLHPLLRQTARDLLAAVAGPGEVKWHCAASDLSL